MDNFITDLLDIYTEVPSGGIEDKHHCWQRNIPLGSIIR